MKTFQVRQSIHYDLMITQYGTGSDSEGRGYLIDSVGHREHRDHGRVDR